MVGLFEWLGKLVGGAGLIAVVLFVALLAGAGVAWLLGHRLDRKYQLAPEKPWWFKYANFGIGLFAFVTFAGVTGVLMSLITGH